jgi:triacylglycerol lipase
MIGSSRTPRILGSLALVGATAFGSIALSAAPASASASASPKLDALVAKRIKPILLVHGFTRTSADFASTITELKANGYPDEKIFTIDYNSFAPNAYVATLIAAKVQAIRTQTGADKVDIVAHSMGAFGVRYFLKNLGGAAVVEDFVSLAGPNHGTTTANTPECGALPSCVEMRTDSPFLAQLNAGDETPGNVRYLTFWSSCDDLVIPAGDSVPLKGALNIKTECLTHMALPVDPKVIKATVFFTKYL